MKSTIATILGTVLLGFTKNRGSKTNLVKKELTIKDAEKLIKVYNEKNKVKTTQQVQKKDTISKKNKKN